MTQANRLAAGGRIDRNRPLDFLFNGKRLEGYAGDTLASALLANGVSIVGRSFKYHRPRGIVGSGAEEPNAIMQIGLGAYTQPNLRATQVELYEGLIAASVNCWPSVEYDIHALTGLFSRILPAGFYYKTFMWPPKLWTWYEDRIRRSAGLGRAPLKPDPDFYDKLNAHCDLLIVGAGPAGLAAALSAARSGARVILADDQNEFGGSLLASRETIDARAPTDWVDQVVGELAGRANVTLLPRTTVFGYYDHNFLSAAQRLTDHLPPGSQAGPRQRRWRIRARRVVLATGAFERALVFSNNDRPGVMQASAVSQYVNRYAVRPGNRAVVFANNDSAYQTALDLHAAGVPVAALVDSRNSGQSSLQAAVADCGIEILARSAVVQVKGARRVGAVQIRRLNGAGDGFGGESRQIPCDLLAVSGGWSPAVHLHSQAGGKNRWDTERVCFVPEPGPQAEVSVGAANGNFSLRDCLSEGFAAGAESASACGFTAEVLALPALQEDQIRPLEALWMVPPPVLPLGRAPKQFVDLQNDTSSADIHLAAREGFRSVEHVKRYTALGFGTDQGKLGNINGMAILAHALDQDIPSTGTTTFRPNYTPIPFGTVAGIDIAERFDPVRKTAMHPWHVEHGAEFENVGQWKRPWYYPRAGEDLHAAVNRECLATRKSVGVMDASTLGKIDVRGKDAAAFLNLIYSNAWLKLGVGRCRYGLMLGEDGMIMDDGVSARIADDHFYMTTTTGGAARVLGHMERWLQTEWPQMEVYLTSVTDQWATTAVVGPKSRAVLQKLCSDIDFDGEQFPFMSLREGRVAGVPARVFRISFSGELAYEINVPADYGRYVWEAVMAAGEEFGITPYGTETMHVLRAEKGFIIVGQDTDGSMTPQDMGMDWAVAKNKEFIGRRSLSREDTLRTDRKQLVGLLTDDPKAVLPEGGQIVAEPDHPVPVPMLGHVTSSYHSAVLGHSIALAVVKGGHGRMGETVFVPLPDGRRLKARIASPVFYDPEGARQNV